MAFSKFFIGLFSILYVLFFFDSHLQSPRKKRDFYGKSHRSPNHVNKSDASLSNKTRPSSTPAVCTEVLTKTSLPDRPVSIPPT
jgi:hypothetical protein